MQATLIMENQDGFRWDIFVNVVCSGLRLSSSMKERALTLFSMDRLSVHMLSLEDIFVFKSVTSRERDREDMYLLFLQGLDFEEFHDMGYSDMLSQMILDRLKKGNATDEEICHEFGVDDIEKHMEYLAKKKLVVRNNDGSYSLNLIL